MIRCLALTMLVAAGPALAQPAPSVGPESVCAAAAAVAERRHGLPDGLLLAIGKVESGRSTALGRQPWPWSINAEGADTVTESAESAVATVRAMQARGMRSIDTGCFQINMLAHPMAFASVEESFEPGANADYAARFLVELHQRSGDWGQAVAAYHSATPWRGETYRQMVWRAWTGTLMPDVPIAGVGAGPGQSGPRAVGGVRMYGFMRVFVPSAAMAVPVRPASASVGAPAPAGVRVMSASWLSGRGRLPMVYRPSLPVSP